MSRLGFQLIQVMNIVCATLVIFCCLVCLGLHGKAESNDGALSVVQQDDDNGIVENDNGDLDITPEKYEPFQPTEEWQTVKKGQAIPAGLHVRMNFETGDKEAKLMDGESEYKYWRDGDRQGMMNMDRKQFSINELKKALKDFKTNELDDTYLQREAEVKKKFRSYEELKEDFAAMNMDIKTDGEIITDLVQKLQHKDIPRDDVITILQDLEYYLHQIDNGVLFKDIGGIPYILNMINRTDDEILQIEASMVLGAVTSSNPKVQIGALEAGSLQLLLRVISLNTSTNVKRKIIYCLSTLCRHFPYAQKKFLELGGLAALGNVFDEPGSEKVKVKIVSLLNDLLIEKILSLEHSNLELSTESEKLKQYNQVHLKEAMIEQGWCERIVSLLKLQDHESREQVLNIMETLSTSCKTIFLKSKSELKTLQTEYSQLSAEELNIGDGSDYFTLILGVINTVLSNIGIKDEL